LFAHKTTKTPLQLRQNSVNTKNMSGIDIDTVRHTAKLARLAIDEARLPQLADELQRLLGLINTMNTADVSGVSLESDPRCTPMRPDAVHEGNIAADIVRNAPAANGHFFTVPKVIE
jgi:aspartyl-tRNA(Asn)/glutamyl-tRNA(Gln) amidotransferase subunit C